MKKMLFAGAAASVLLALTAGLVFADDDDYRERYWERKPARGVAMVDNPKYREECGSCHMAYQPGLLPARSWERIMAGLEDHFGENAELAEEDRQELLNYLLNGAAGRTNYRVSNKLMRGMKEAPLRITELPYFRHEHREIPRRMVTGNPKVRSLSNCDACHRKADQGSFRERDIYIPGYGRYDDD